MGPNYLEEGCDTWRKVRGSHGVNDWVLFARRKHKRNNVNVRLQN